jgi:hypothetical protein
MCSISLPALETWNLGFSFDFSCARAGGFNLCLHQYTYVFVVVPFFRVLFSTLHVPIDVCHEESRCDIRKDLFFSVYVSLFRLYL